MYVLTGLFKNRKCQGTQHRLGWCSAMILPNLSHFYNVKKMVQGVWNIFCLVQAVMEGPKWPIFWDPAPFFLPYQNGSNLVESLLSTISSFAEIPGIFDFWKDQLLHIRVIEFLRNFEFRNWHTMRGGLMLPDSISEEKLEIDWKMEDLQARLFWCRLLMTPEQPAPERPNL